MRNIRLCKRCDNLRFFEIYMAGASGVYYKNKSVKGLCCDYDLKSYLSMLNLFVDVEGRQMNMVQMKADVRIGPLYSWEINKHKNGRKNDSVSVGKFMLRRRYFTKMKNMDPPVECKYQLEHVVS